MQANQANVAFNTREEAKALKGAGFDEKQAESVVETINQAVNETVATKADLEVMASKMATKEELKTLATKDDLKNMATKAEIEVLTKTVEGIQENIDKNMATKVEIGKLETRIMRMMWLQLMAILGMFVTLVVALP